MVTRASASAVGGGGGGAPSDGSSTSSSAHSSAGPFNSGSGSSSVTESSSLWQMFADNQDVTLDDFVARALRSPDTALGQLITVSYVLFSLNSLTHSQTQSHSFTYSHSYLSHSNATLSYPISFVPPPLTPVSPSHSYPPPLTPTGMLRRMATNHSISNRIFQNTFFSLLETGYVHTNARASHSTQSGHPSEGATGTDATPISGGMGVVRTYFDALLERVFLQVT